MRDYIQDQPPAVRQSAGRSEQSLYGVCDHAEDRNAQRTHPYLRTRGLRAWAVALLIGIGIIRLSLIWMDPRRADSAGHLIVVGALAATLVVWGLLRPSAARGDQPVPRPRSLVAIGAVCVVGYFAFLMQLPGAQHSAYLPDRFAWLAPVVALILLAVAAVVCRRWSTSTRWTPAHTAALIIGALPAHSLLSLFVMPLSTADRVALVLIMLGEVGFGIWMIGRARGN